jgi:hypothetical protein
LGAEGIVEQNNPEAGAVITRIGERTLAMGYPAAETLLVEVED